MGVAAASPSWAAVNGDNRNLEIDYSRDFVLLEGYPADTDIQVDVLRNGVSIGKFVGQAENNARGLSTLEINHVGGGQYPLGDCWQSPATPDILPGDKVQATVLNTPSDVDYTFVRDLTFTEDAASGNVSGRAMGVEGAGGSFDLATPLTLGANDFLEGKRVADTVERVFITPAADRPFTNVNIPGSGGEVTLQYVKASAGVEAVESTVASPDGTVGGPATPECPDFAQTGISSVSSDIINLANVGTNLTINGVAQDGITGVNVALGGKTYPATPANGTWTLTVPAADLGTLPQGRSNVVASFVGNVAPPDQTRTILKDTVAPRAPRATPRAGTYSRAQSVTLSAEAGAKIRYTVDGRTPTATSRLFVNPIRVTGTQTIKAVAYDAAGNRGEVAAFRYVIR